MDQVCNQLRAAALDAERVPAEVGQVTLTCIPAGVLFRIAAPPRDGMVRSLERILGWRELDSSWMITTQVLEQLLYDFKSRGA
jgi:hypothetical protein